MKQWLTSETEEINAEIKMNKKNPRYDREMYWKISILTIAFFVIFNSINADCIVESQTTVISHEEQMPFETLMSAQWRCKRCNRYIYKDSPDNWRGEYFCPCCGCPMGEE